jgi:hypothetical protein
MTLPEKHPDVAYVSDTLWEAALTMACNRQCYIFESFISITNWESEIAIGIIDHARCLILLGEVKGPVDPLAKRKLPQDEADLCRNDGADDIAQTLDDAINEIEALRQPAQSDVQIIANERKAIAAWLRGEVDTDYTDPEYDIGRNLADAVERGAYIQEQSNG